MDRSQAKDIVKGYLQDYLQNKGINTRKPFTCLNPAHPDKHPSMSYDRLHQRCKCFSCGATYDIFDLIGMDYKLTDNRDIFNKAYELYGITIDGQKLDSQPAQKQIPEQHAFNTDQMNIHAYTQIEDLPEETTIDFTPEIEEAHRRLLANEEALKHYTGRGLSMEMIKAYKLGYYEEGYNRLLAKHPENQCKSKKAALYRYVLPYPDAEGHYSYFVTEIADRTQIDEYNGKYRKISKGETGIKAQLFNERYIQTQPPVVFVCEGVYDALSVEEAGGKAIAFVGTAHRRFLSLCKKYKPNTLFIISLDNDGAGQKAIERVAEGLEELGIPYRIRTAENGKDFNEALQTDREAFTEYIEQIEDEVEQERKAAEEAELEEYLKTSAAAHIQDFLDGIVASVNTPAISTGFYNLDNILDGGLYEGLYLLGAISSLGKTTFALQLADNLAQQGQDVLIFSLEMARTELMSKSLSRLTYLTAENKADAKTARGITAGARYLKYSQQEKALIDKAIKQYQEYAQHIYIHEGIGDIGVREVKDLVQQHITITGNKPVVIIDYVQILAPYDLRSTDKQNMDKAVLELKRLSRDCKITVLGISSFNRESYKNSYKAGGGANQGKVSMTDFKESGALEYSADVLMGFEFGSAGSKDYDERLEKRKNPREVRLVVLKNRNGKAWENCSFNYFPLFNYFYEA